MKRNLLYYPGMSLPNKSWIYNSVLYTDSISTILPYDTLVENKVDALIWQLYDEGIYEPIFARKSLRSLNNDMFEEEFISHAQNYADQPKKSTLVTSGGNVNIIMYTNESLNLDTLGFHLFDSKLTPKVRDFLYTSNLVDDARDGRIGISPKLALIYMNLLASHFAANSKDAVTLSTNYIEYEDDLFKSSNNRITGFDLDLFNCLPVPDINVPIDKLIKFKRKRSDELLRFQLEFTKMIEELRNANEQQEINHVIMKWQATIQTNLNDLSDLLGDSKIEFALKGIKSVANFSNKLNTFLIGATAAFDLKAGGIALMVSLISEFNSIHKNSKSNAYSYLYHAKKEGILN